MKVQKKINTIPREKLKFSTPKEGFSNFVCNIALASWHFKFDKDYNVQFCELEEITK